jgi:hypothetical protein
MDRIDTIYHPIKPIQSQGFKGTGNWQVHINNQANNHNLHIALANQ